CLRKVDPALIYPLIEQAGVTHMCGAPIVMNLLAHAPEEVRRPLAHPVRVMTGGAAPPSSVIMRLEQQGFEVLHAYGLTESHGARPPGPALSHAAGSQRADPRSAGSSPG